MMDNWRYVEEFNADQELHRILPVGKFKRFGRTVEITPAKVQDMVANFNRAIPDTGVPINAEHTRSEGRVGQVVGLQARSDGAYAALQFTEAGQKLMAEARFQYVSPEIVWGPTDWEQHDNVSNILVGLALTNSPFFGRDVSLFSLNDRDGVDFRADGPTLALVGGDRAGDEKVTVAPLSESAANKLGELWLQMLRSAPASMALSIGNNGDTDDPLNNQNEEEPMEDEQKIPEWFTQLFKGKGDPPAPVQHTGPTPEEFEALQKAKQELEDKLSKQQAEREHAARVAEYTALVPEGAPDGLPEDLARFAAVNPDAAKRLVEEFAALRKQADEGGLFSEKGSGTSHDEHASEVVQFNALVDQAVKEKGLPRDQAMNLVAKERPDLVKAVRGGK